MTDLAAIYQWELKRFLRGIEYGCWALGVLASLWFAVVSLDIFWFQKVQATRWEKQQQSMAVRGAAPFARPADMPFGRIFIPRIGLSAMIAEGDDESTLRHAVGHIPGTSAPGHIGNIVLAGHRDTFFRPLNRIRSDDLIVLETPQGKYQYQVIRTIVVPPQRTDLLQPSAEADLTLITCFPFHFIGPAPKRFVVQALRIAAPQSQ